MYRLHCVSRDKITFTHKKKYFSFFDSGQDLGPFLAAGSVEAFWADHRVYRPTSVWSSCLLARSSQTPSSGVWAGFLRVSATRGHGD